MSAKNRFLIGYLLFGGLNLSEAASREYRSKKFLTAVTTEQSLEAITRQLARGANVNYFGDLGVTKDIYEWRGTALHWAAKHNRTNLVELLLVFGADKAILDSNAKAAFRYAQHKKLKSKLKFVPMPKNLAEGLGFGRHINIFAHMPMGWDMGDISPSAQAK